MSNGKGFNFGMAYNRPQDWIAPYDPNPPAPSGFTYTDYGYLPNVAQNTQQLVVPPPSLNPQPHFSTADYAAANWFTTRVHLSPLGSINNGQ